MKVACVTVAYKEERFIQKWVKHVPHGIPVLVLNSITPWYGEAGPDKTWELAEAAGAEVVPFNWPTEHDQRNDGQVWFHDYDWIITLDPDEFLTQLGWGKLLTYLKAADGDAYVCEKQLTYWKNGYVVDPPEDYRQIIAVRPNVRFWDKRCVDCPYGDAPVTLHHFSWAKTDEEVASKLAHYSHNVDFDTMRWYKEVWLKWQPHDEDFHPLTPSALHSAKKAKLPKELENLKLWPETPSVSI